MQPNDHPIERARGDFEHFVQHFDTSNLAAHGDPHPPYLVTYLSDWIDNGRGIEATGERYEFYLQTVIDIGDAALQGKLDLGFRGSLEGTTTHSSAPYERQIIGIHAPGCVGEWYLERAEYEAQVARYRARGRTATDRYMA
jgi:hypothetical protein